tara:strand:+ start:923 stop:2986 length:2064 start_codon:yes stop_codon:yes gene_type:complete
MSEFFLELFSEEVPPNLQKSARQDCLENFKELFKERNLSFKKSLAYSTPNRLIILFEGLQKKIVEKKQEIRGPNTSAPDIALKGFLKSNRIKDDQVFIKKTDKGEFYFFNKPENSLNTSSFLEQKIPYILDKIKWKKSMKWGSYELTWARPLKSILGIFDNKILKFKYHHLISSNNSILDKEFEEKRKNFSNFENYNNHLKKLGLVINNEQRKKIIENTILKIAKKKELIVDINLKLLEEVSDLVERPSIIVCKFDKKFLKIPKEILVTSMQVHQKYFHTLDKKDNITNEFFVVANNKDIKGFIKSGNERVVEARLNDAEFFWNKNKSQNLVKQVSKLQNISYFKGLGSYFDKIQRMRKLGGIISDELLISKEKIELSASICKVDLISDLVGEFPELQGIMGGYFAAEQGFDKEISLAISEHYLPLGPSSKIPKKKFSVALALTDKLDTLIGFFGINQKPSSSRDPYALRRIALGVIRIIIENNLNLKLKELINYSILLYEEQGFKFKNENTKKDLLYFLFDRLKYYMKEKKIRHDIIDASINSYSIENLIKVYDKAQALNKIIDTDIGIDIISSYKRASNILDTESANLKSELSGTSDPGIFKNDYEKNLYKKIHDLRKYFTGLNRDENYLITLNNLASTKTIIIEFFDNVIVNDKDQLIRKNRLELLQMFCKTFDNYITFSKIES